MKIKLKFFKIIIYADYYQNIVLQLYYVNPDLFQIIYNNKWFSLFITKKI